MSATLAQVLEGAVTAASQVAIRRWYAADPPEPPRPILERAPRQLASACPQPAADVRDAEVERVLALGATLFEDHRRPDRTGWVVLADPEGNEFCIERGVSGG
jgi:Glyoxalase-like domain